FRWPYARPCGQAKRLTSGVVESILPDMLTEHKGRHTNQDCQRPELVHPGTPQHIESAAGLTDSTGTFRAAHGLLPVVQDRGFELGGFPHQSLQRLKKAY